MFEHYWNISFAGISICVHSDQKSEQYDFPFVHICCRHKNSLVHIVNLGPIQGVHRVVASHTQSQTNSFCTKLDQYCAKYFKRLILLVYSTESAEQQNLIATVRPYLKFPARFCFPLG